MQKVKKYKGIIILTLIVLMGVYYWYEWRPAQIRKECAKGAREIATFSVEKGGDPDAIFKEAYDYCINIPFLTPKIK